MAKVLVGRDVYGYTLAPAGADTIQGGFALGSAVNLLGKFKSITFELEDEWADVSPSSAGLKEKRKIISDWRGTLENQIRSGGSTGLEVMLGYDYVQIVCQDEANGKTITAYGGINKASYKRDRGEAMETLEIENVGDIANLGNSFFYI